ncbi:MAG: biotin transporter BioY [Clostridiales Family XIII bacterium]|jgi:biotin transport system substrate-specific component|nr:biotin transporter BioY [Clostridiales Family XIII bacterium]
MQKTSTLKMILCAMFAAITAVLSQIVVPIGPVPISLGTLAVFCAGSLLGSRLGALSIAVWVALGIIGVPVFAMFRAGVGTLAGPTGGYIAGYIPAAFITGLLIEKFSKGGKTTLYPVFMLAGMATYFILGTSWFVISTGTGIWEALMVCVIPFLPGDFLKIAAATVLAKRLRPILHTMAGTKAASIGDGS